MLEKYINIPYLNQGRSLEGADCWGLAILMYELEIGIKLPYYGDINAENLYKIYKTMDVDKDGELWEDVPKGEQKLFDICVMSGKNSRRVCHAGVVIDKKRIIHIEKGIDSIIVPVNHFSIRERIVCYRRYKIMK